MTGSSKDLPTTFLSTSRTSFGQSISRSDTRRVDLLDNFRQRGQRGPTHSESP